MHKRLIATFLVLLCGLAALPAGAGTLEDVRKRGELRCGVHGDLPGFAARTPAGIWAGFDVDICRAVAAAVLGDADKVSLTPASAEDRFALLAENRFDLLARNTTWTLARDAGAGAQFVAVNYYDGQGFMVRKAAGLRSTLQLGGSRVCVSQATTSALNVRDYFAVNRMPLELVESENAAAALAAYAEGRCDALTSDMSQLFSLRTGLEQPGDHRILPELISKEPLAPAVRDDDPQWFNIVRWTVFALIEAEEMGIDSANVERIRANAERPEIRRLLGVEDNLGAGLGLSADWAFQVVSQVGNYAEIFDRNLGDDSVLKMNRGINALWLDGGLMFAPPMR